MTILEFAVYLVLFLLLGGPLVSAVLVSTRTTSEVDAFNRVDERNRTALVRMARDVRCSIEGNLTVTNGGKTLVLTPALGYDGTGTIPGPALTYTLQLVSTESMDGADNDGNGLADEGELVRTDAGSGLQVTICRQIDLNASGFVNNAPGVTITLRSWGGLREGGTFALSRSQTLFPRN